MHPAAADRAGRDRWLWKINFMALFILVLQTKLISQRNIHNFMGFIIYDGRWAWNQMFPICFLCPYRHIKSI